MIKKIGIIIVVLIVLISVVLIYFKKESTLNSINENNNILEDNNENKLDDNTYEEDNANTEGNGNMNEFTRNIKIIINNKEYSATLEDNETSRELVSRLPITITMSELNGNEKYYYFDESFPTNSTRISTINTGDIMLYGSDCLVIFYETFNISYSYTRIGKIDNPEGLKNNLGNGNVSITFKK